MIDKALALFVAVTFSAAVVLWLRGIYLVFAR